MKTLLEHKTVVAAAAILIGLIAATAFLPRRDHQDHKIGGQVSARFTEREESDLALRPVSASPQAA
ncbi:MAG: hypothetical protein WCL39_13750, partial [Armatimonadota bacterium]